ncbi:hypothetical protein IWQ62_001686 [Dispira parvispora]|uniref:Cyclin-D1-binding protein 1-like N-terminal domain-containing protein n=1 Tax=Dispira parvispora TaxID=1520584 RepID=A0A9W8E3J7_9FUNG|nr:hypothetical protein IWQ62_001686 [Dispira parvispora]
MVTSQSHYDHYSATLAQLAKQCRILTSLIGNPAFRSYNETSTLVFDDQGNTLKTLTSKFTKDCNMYQLLKAVNNVVSLDKELRELHYHENECTKISLSYNNADVYVLGQASCDRLLQTHIPLVVSFLKTFPRTAGKTLLDTYYDLVTTLLQTLQQLAEAVKQSFDLTVQGQPRNQGLEQNARSCAQKCWDACKALREGPHTNQEAVRMIWQQHILPLVEDAESELTEGLRPDTEVTNAVADEDGWDLSGENIESWPEEKKRLAQTIQRTVGVVVQLFRKLQTPCLQSPIRVSEDSKVWLDELLTRGRAISDQIDATVASLWEGDEMEVVQSKWHQLRQQSVDIAHHVVMVQNLDRRFRKGLEAFVCDHSKPDTDKTEAE